MSNNLIATVTQGGSIAPAWCSTILRTYDNTTRLSWSSASSTQTRWVSHLGSKLSFYRDTAFQSVLLW